MKKSLIALSFIASCAPAYAQVQVPINLVCFPKEVLKTAMSEKFGQVARFRGLLTDEMMETVYVNKEEGTFSIVRERANSNMACLVSAGEHGSFIDPPKPETF